MSGHIINDADRAMNDPRGRRNEGAAIICAVKNRKKCSTRCPIFELCPMMPLSISRANPGSPCLLNKGGNAMIRRFINLVARGEQGMLDEINSTLYHYSFDIETAPKSVQERYIGMLTTLHKQLYVDPRGKAMEEKPQLTVVIHELGSDRKVEVVPLLEAGRIGGADNNSIVGQIVAQAEHEDDEDSLITSPILQDIISSVKPQPAKHHLSAEARHTEQGPGGRFRRKNDIQEQDSQTGNDVSPRIEGEPEELAETSERSGGGT